MSRPSAKKGLKPLISDLSRHPPGAGITGGIVATVVGGAILYLMTTTPPPPARPIVDLISREAALALKPHTEKDLEDYGNLFAEEGSLVFDGGTGQPWKGRKEIIDRLRPLHFNTLVHGSVHVQVWPDGIFASAETETTFDQDAPAAAHGPDREFWTFKKIGNTWQIVSLEIGYRGNLQ